MGGERMKEKLFATLKRSFPLLLSMWGITLLTPPVPLSPSSSSFLYPTLLVADTFHFTANSPAAIELK
jgi:hypothetical protein